MIFNFYLCVLCAYVVNRIMLHQKKSYDTKIGAFIF